MKKIVSIILSCLMITMALCTTVDAAEIDGNKELMSLNVNESGFKNKISIPADAQQFAEDNYCDLIMAGQEDYSYNISETNKNKLILESPFVLYDKDETVWDEIYYYPISYKDKIILVMSVINTTAGWALSASEEFVKELNDLEYQKDSVNTFCYDNDRNQIKPVELNTVSDITNNDIMNMQPIDIAKIKMKSNLLSIKEGYTPSYSFNITTGSDVGQIFKLYNRQGQGNLNICWAASVATIVNYLQGKNLSAKKVCDDNGYSYVGQNISVKSKVLKNYGIIYSIQMSALSWKVVIKNVEQKQPVAMSTFRSNGDGHAVTLIGYRFRNGNKYIVLWNSGNEEVQTVLYKEENTVYQYSNSAWTWTKSLASYII